MSDSVRPHRRQPTRLLCPWDSPGKNTGVGCHFLLQCMKVKTQSEVSQSCPTLSDPMDCSLPGSSVHRIFQARVLKWGAIAYSSLIQSQALCSCPWTSWSHLWILFLCRTQVKKSITDSAWVHPVASVMSNSLWPHVVACQAPLFLGFFRQEYWSELPFPSPGDLSNSRIEPGSLMSPALAGRFLTTSVTCKKLTWLLSSGINFHWIAV